MKPIKFKLIAIGWLGIFLCLSAAAENEATYSPDGLLTIPHLNLLDATGSPIASYEVTMQKERNQWRFELVTVTDLPLSIPDAGGESILGSSGRLYIPHTQLLNSQGQVIRNYAVYMKKDSHWRFTIYGLTDLDAADNTSTNSSDTNTTSNVTASVAGDWEFSFHHKYDNSFTGTDFTRTTNSPPPTPDILSMTLEQDDVDVRGTGTLSSVEYTLSGQISGDLFSFSILTGHTNSTMGIISGHVAVTEDSMGGDYFATTTNSTSAIISGPATANKL